MPVDDLVRFALGPDDEIVPDIDAKAPGRGVWITLSEAAVAEAVRKKTFARSLKQAVNVPQDLAFEARTRLEQRLLGALGMARGAGQLVTGAAKVSAAVSKPGLVALITAEDAAPDGRRKMAGMLKARQDKATIPHFTLLPSAKLGLALGQENVVHAALISGAAAQMALKRAERLARYIGSVETKE